MRPAEPAIRSRRPFARRALLAAAAIVSALLVRGIDAQSILVFEDWSAQPLQAQGIPAGWKSIVDAVEDLPLHEHVLIRAHFTAVPPFAIAANGSEQVLRVTSKDREHSIIVKSVTGVDLNRTPILEWKWRADVLPRGANLRKKDKADSAAEIHLVWRAGKRTIGYAWDETLALGDQFPNPRQQDVQFLIVSNGPARPEWISVARDVAADHLKIYGVPPSGPPDRLAISIDSNQTESTAEALIGRIAFRAR